MFENLRDKIKDKKLILFGEIHGTKEIPKLIEKFLIEIAKTEEFNICLEIPEEFQEKIDEFMESGNDDVLENIPFFLEPDNQDGRGSLEYLDIIKEINNIDKNYKRNIKIFCIDSNSDNQERRESYLAENILKKISDKKTFAILGDVHASKSFVSFFGKKFLPAGGILFNKLGNKMFSTRILPKKGEFFNFGVKKIIESNSEDLFNKNFDYIHELEKVTPCSFQKIKKTL